VRSMHGRSAAHGPRCRRPSMGAASALLRGGCTGHSRWTCWPASGVEAGLRVESSVKESGGVRAVENPLGLPPASARQDGGVFPFRAGRSAPVPNHGNSETSTCIIEMPAGGLEGAMSSIRQVNRCQPGECLRKSLRSKVPLKSILDIVHAHLAPDRETP
jgi:hypothetical protein